mmetsp:Transcript_47109/g.55023  ORF Transcript_47109/g.55023 Transcript_47109/m.55023 type:complete len:286 (-) Transcript_47109:757-1614(-)
MGNHTPGCIVRIKIHAGNGNRRLYRTYIATRCRQGWGDHQRSLQHHGPHRQCRILVMTSLPHLRYFVHSTTNVLRENMLEDHRSGGEKGHLARTQLLLDAIAAISATCTATATSTSTSAAEGPLVVQTLLFRHHPKFHIPALFQLVLLTLHVTEMEINLGSSRCAPQEPKPLSTSTTTCIPSTIPTPILEGANDPPFQRCSGHHFGFAFFPQPIPFRLDQHDVTRVFSLGAAFQHHGELHFIETFQACGCARLLVRAHIFRGVLQRHLLHFFGCCGILCIIIRCH